MKKLSIEIEKEAIDLYVIGKKSTPEIAKILGISSTSISNILKRNNLYRRNISEAVTGRRKISNDRIYEIIRLYVEEGKTGREISKILNCSTKTVFEVLDENEIETREPGWINYHHPAEQKIIDLYNTGIGMHRISVQLNLPYTTINSILGKLDIIRSDEKGKGLSGSKNGNFGIPWNPNQRNNTYIARTGYSFEDYIKRLPVYKRYRNLVTLHTNRQNLSSLKNFDKRGIRKYHLDHKYSIMEGFKNNVNPELLGDIANLEMLPYQDNLKKKNKCSISLIELIHKSGNQFETYI